MTTRKVDTRFMRGNIDVDGCIFDLLVDNFGMSEVCSSIISFDEAIYSDGFICAIEEGKVPSLEVVENCKKNNSREYHHVLYNDECYVMYFN
jgi:hypothetical protein